MGGPGTQPGVAARKDGAPLTRFAERNFVRQELKRDQAAFNSGLERAERMMAQSRQREL